MHIGPEDVVMELVNPEHLHVELSVFEKDVMQVKKGQTITFSIPEADDQSYQLGRRTRG